MNKCPKARGSGCDNRNLHNTDTARYRKRVLRCAFRIRGFPYLFHSLAPELARPKLGTEPNCTVPRSRSQPPQKKVSKRHVVGCARSRNSMYSRFLVDLMDRRGKSVTKYESRKRIPRARALHQKKSRGSLKRGGSGLAKRRKLGAVIPVMYWVRRAGCRAAGRVAGFRSFGSSRSR